MSSFWSFILISSAFIQTQDSYHHPYCPTYTLTLLPSHIASHHLHHFLSSSIAYCPSQPPCIYTYHFPSCREQVEPIPGSLLVNTRFLLFMHTDLLVLILFSIHQLHASFIMQPIANTGTWYLVHDPHCSMHLAFVSTPKLALQYLNYLLFAAIFVILHRAPSLSC